MRIFLLAAAAAAAVCAQERVDHAAIARIKTEAFQNSRVMDTLGYLTDVIGPRVKGTPGYRAAADWTRNQFEQWGLANAHLEMGDYTGTGWTARRYSLEMSAPQFSALLAAPLAWSSNTSGTVSGTPVLVEINSAEDISKYRGKLKDVIVMNGKLPAKPAARFESDAHRLTAAQLEEAASATDPFKPTSVDKDVYDTYQQTVEKRRTRYQRRAAIARFFQEEGVAAVIVPSILPSGRLVTKDISMDAGGFDMDAPTWRFPSAGKAPPTFVLAQEHYGRIQRLLERQSPVTLAANLQGDIHSLGGDPNVLAEIPGSDLKDQVVMLGAHLDSWHLATGATDNAAGSAVVMEVMRILKTLGVRPRRTIRAALWSAEEGGLFGSYRYVRDHFADIDTGQKKPGYSNLAAYFNLDNGTGRIRGVYLQGNEAVRTIFEAWLAPFHYLGASTLSVQRVGGTDHLPFEYAGLPAFQFIQDPVDYDSRTHHTNLDGLEAILPDDLRQAAAVMASFVYHAAMRDDRLPGMGMK